MKPKSPLTSKKKDDGILISDNALILRVTSVMRLIPKGLYSIKESRGLKRKRKRTIIVLVSDSEKHLEDLAERLVKYGFEIGRDMIYVRRHDIRFGSSDNVLTIREGWVTFRERNCYINIFRPVAYENGPIVQEPCSR